MAKKNIQKKQWLSGKAILLSTLAICALIVLGSVLWPRASRKTTKRTAVVPVQAISDNVLDGEQEEDRGVYKPREMPLSGMPAPPRARQQTSPAYKAWCRQTFDVLVREHPDPRISKKLLADFRSGRVELAWYFGEAPDGTEAVAVWDDGPNGSRMSYVVLTQPFFRTDRDRAYKETAMLHEYVHIEQAHSGLIDPEIFRKGRSQYTPKEVRQRYEAEVAAYDVQCKYNKRHKHAKSSMTFLCREVDSYTEVDFRLTIANMLADGQPHLYARHRHALMKWAQDGKRLKDL